MRIVRYQERGKLYKEEFIGTEAEIRERLFREGKVVLTVEEPFVLFQKRASNQEVQAVLGALGDLLSVGVKLSEALETVIVSIDRHSKLRGICLTMLDAVKTGKSLPDVMASYPQVFGYTIVSMVRAGLDSGNLGQSLTLAANHLKKISSIKSQMIKKLTYPVGVLLVGIGSMTINTVFVIPKLIKSDLFKMAAQGETNNYIKVLQAINLAMPALLVLIVAVAFFLGSLFKARQEQIERILFRMALVRELIFYRSYYVTFFSLANLIKAGVPLAPALEIARNSTSLFTIRKEIDDGLHYLRSGESFVKGLKNLTHIERTMLEVAHNSDRVQEHLSDIANGFYQKYLDKIESVAPKIYAAVMVFVITTFMLTFLGIFMPYTKILGGIK